MSNYRRLISYIYAYEGGIKGKNIGFAKIETRGAQCKIGVNVKKVYVGSNDMGVYLLSGDREIYLGKIFIRNGSGEFRALVSSSDVERSGSGIDECYGLTVHEVENAWQAYTTIWEDAVAHTAEIELKDVTSQNRLEKERAGSDEKEAKDPYQDVVEELEKEIQQMESRENVEIEAVSDSAEAEREEPQSETAEVEAPSGVESQEMDEVPEEWKIEAKAPESVCDNLSITEQAEKEPVAQSFARPKLHVSGADGYQYGYGPSDLEGSDKEISVAEKIQKGLAGTDPEAAKPPEMDGTERPCEMWRGEEAGNARTAPGVSESPEELIGNPEDLTRLMDEEKVEQAETNHSSIWEQFRKAHTKVQAFDYEKGCEILMIKPQDIGLLPRDNWVYGNNSFLLHGFYNYRYLILARLNSTSGLPRYLLGVPGHYYSNEKYMASMFGFPNFVLSKTQPVKEGRFGYWYRDIRLGS